MSKIVKLQNGKEIDLDLLYPKRESVYHIDEYDPADDIYGEVTEEERIKYGLQKA